MALCVCGGGGGMEKRGGGESTEVVCLCDVRCRLGKSADSDVYWRHGAELG